MICKEWVKAGIFCGKFDFACPQYYNPRTMPSIAETRPDRDLYSLLRDEVFNVDHMTSYKDFTSEIRGGLANQFVRDWPQFIPNEHRDLIDLSRVLLEEGREIIEDVFRPTPYGEVNISKAIDMARAGEDPLAVQLVLDKVENPYLVGGVDFGREIMASSYMSAALKAKKENGIKTAGMMLDGGIPLLAQAIAARRQTAQARQS